MTYRNELIKERSPYLLQHAHNPVAWTPWSSRAFDMARRENKPVFLSIGYSSCHWCHVMERESFEDAEVARILNESFISIKVDREERPDIDAAYMEVCQAMTGRGGWPLSIFLTPDKMPIYAGTYFPVQSRMGQIGFIDLTRRIAGIWANESERLKVSGANMISLIKQREDEMRSSQNGTLEREILRKAAAVFNATYDEQYGGFGDRPKFPAPHNYVFLLRLSYSSGNKQLQLMATESLLAMRRGGIFDHIGYGFHRYSADEQWFMPHFEKMLYDQAMLAYAYAEAAASTGDPRFFSICEEIFEYVRRDLTSLDGAFYSSEDADSENTEGQFYTWSWDEFRRALPNSLTDAAATHFQLSLEGNYRDESTGAETGKNILHESPQTQSLSSDELSLARALLLERRSARKRPMRDEKILVDWNGLMIAALAYFGRISNKNEYVDRAKTAADFLLDAMYADDQLLRSYSGGEATISGFLDDYAFLAWGLFELYQATADIKYFVKCHKLCEQIISKFQDDNGGFLQSPRGLSDTPFDWLQPNFDSSIPSGNSSAIYALARMGALCGEQHFIDAAQRSLQSFSGKIEKYPAGFSWMLTSLDFLSGKRFKIVISGNSNSREYVEIQRYLRTQYAPDSVILYNDGSEELASYFDSGAISRGDKPAVFICDEASCRLTARSLDELRAAFGNL